MHLVAIRVNIRDRPCGSGAVGRICAINGMRESCSGGRVPHLDERHRRSTGNCITTTTSTVRSTQAVSAIVGIATIEIVKIDEIGGLIVEISTGNIECEPLCCAIVMDQTGGHGRSEDRVAMTILKLRQRATRCVALNVTGANLNDQATY